MFEDYREAVVRDYQAKLADGSLSLNLIKPTPAGIKKEWLFVFETRRKKDDRKTLRLFFGEKDDEEDYGKALKKIEVDKFRPLCKFLNKETQNPDDKIIELLAWLIDFPDRPYKYGVPFPQNQLDFVETNSEQIEKSQEISRVESENTVGGNTHSPATGQKEGGPAKDTGFKLTRKYKGAIIAFSIVIAIATGSFVWKYYHKECMYWDGQKYIAADCNVDLPTSELIALDESKLNNLKWITQPDTITEKHINKVWYIRNKNMIELFTCEGVYPLDRKRRLFPLSKKIYDKYVATNKVRVK